MQRFQKFIGRKIDYRRAGPSKETGTKGVSELFVPDELDDFDEMEFGLGSWEGKEIVFTLVLEHGELARISLGYIPEGGSEDDMMAFTEAQLAEVMAAKGQLLESFLDAIFPE